MNDPRSPLISRRQALKAGIAAVGIAAAERNAIAAAADSASAAHAVTRAIPSTGERLPVIGLGTNNYSVTSAEDLALRREVLARMPDLGGKVIDTAPAYGQSEVVLGNLLAELGSRDRFFLATKVTALVARSGRLNSLSPSRVGLRPQDAPYSPTSQHFRAANKRLQKIRAADSDICVVCMTALPSVEVAVRVLKAQAFDYIEKPLAMEEVGAVIQAAIREKGLLVDLETRLNQEVGRRLRERRQGSQLTLKQLANRTGLSVSLISQIELGKSAASMSTLHKLSTALQIKMTYFFETI